jgi:hypothetical protein
MIRKLSLFVFVTALVVSACGRQVTPNRPGYGGGTPGYMTVKFNVQSPFNFASYRYVFVFNTTGDGITPYGNVLQTNYQGYSFALVVSSNGGGTAGVQAVQYIRQAGTNVPILANLNPSAVQLQFNPNSNGLGTQFTVTFARALFYGYVTPSPGPALATLSSTRSPAAATPTPSPSPSPTSSASAAPYPTTQAQVNWTFNAFVYQPGAPSALDSMGSGGGTDTTFQSPQLATNQAFDNVVTASIGVIPSDPAAEITGVEFINNP